jgi:hypothetical protein
VLEHDVKRLLFRMEAHEAEAQATEVDAVRLGTLQNPRVHDAYLGTQSAEAGFRMAGSSGIDTAEGAWRKGVGQADGFPI